MNKDNKVEALMNKLNPFSNIKKVKANITMSMLAVSVVVACVVGTVCILKSNEIIIRESKKLIVINAQNESGKIYKDFLKVEKSVDNLSNVVTGSIESKNLTNSSYMKNYDKLLVVITQEFAKNTDWNMSSYIYFVPDVTKGIYGAWVVYDPKTDSFKNIPDIAMKNEFKASNKNFVWYYNAINAKKGVWTNLYLDNDLKTPMISYSKPIKIKNKISAVIGMDISVENLNRMVKNIKLYKENECLLIDNNYNIIANNENYTNKDNLKEIENGKYKYLIEQSKNKKTGLATYKDDGVEKFASYSTLPNGYKLFLSVPVSEVLKAMIELRILLILIIILVIIIVDVFAIGFVNSLLETDED